MICPYLSLKSPGNVMDISQKFPGHVLDMSWKFPGNVAGIFPQEFRGNVHEHFPEISRKCP